MWLNKNEAVSMAKEPQISAGPEWADDALPACAVGMDLLRRLEKARPNDYVFFKRKTSLISVHLPSLASPSGTLS